MTVSPPLWHVNIAFVRRVITWPIVQTSCDIYPHRKKINVRQSLFRTRSSSICLRHESAVWSCSVSGGVEISIVIERSRMFHSDSLLVADAFVSHRFELIIFVSRILPGGRMIRQLTVVSSHAVFMTISAAVTTLGTIGLSIWFTAFQVVRQEGRTQ